ncbi:MAG TPA: cytochrome c oxidase assembly protein [Pirellulales bacterium]|jgi:cytochrome c oxidase assembly factor CtaG/polyferredoxin
MNPTVAAFLRSWSLAPWTIFACVITGVIYARGWRQLVLRPGSHWTGYHLTAFFAGLAALLLAVCSPLEPFSGLLLSAHMVQHMLLMYVAPPLLLLGTPQLPLMRGLPREVLRYWIAPLLRLRAVHIAVEWLTYPPTGWVAATVMLWIWHIPVMYELALGSEFWHIAEHACFFVSAMLFWWPVVQPWPSRPLWPRAAMLPYLFLAAMPATVLCAFLTFADHVVYPRYDAVPRVGGLSALTDQAVAGALMWVLGTLAYLVPLAWIATQLLYPGRRIRGTHRGEESRVSEGRFSARQIGPAWPRPAIAMAYSAKTQSAAYVALPIITRSPMFDVLPRNPTGLALASLASTRQFAGGEGVMTTLAGPSRKVMSADLLRIPVLGPVLSWPYTRRILQCGLFLLATVIVIDGFTGPDVAPLNLAGVLPWVHWRGILVLTLLFAGNLFCMACPLTLPRAVARRFVSPRWNWPTWLRSKWLAVGLLLLFFWAYEALDLWLSPWWTAWIIVGYFVLAFVVDVVFRGAAFCKYVCPVGQFQFVQSLVSPWQVRVRDTSVCASCRTKECMRGGDNVRGCEMQLHVPRKRDNLDCTFCLDCVHACPVANVGILTAIRTADAPRSASDVAAPLGQRADVAALVAFLTFAAFSNAAGMIAPVVDAEQWLERATGFSPMAVETMYLLTSLIVIPLLLLTVVSFLARDSKDLAASVTGVVSQFAPALAPIGAAMWLAHYGFHLVVGANTWLPATVRLAGDWGWKIAGTQSIARRCCAIDPPDWLLRAEIFSLDVGLLMSLYLVFRAANDPSSLRRTLKKFLPWSALIVALFVLAIWIVHQPMEMRGTLPANSALGGTP